MNRIVKRTEAFERSTEVEKTYALVEEPSKLDAMADAVVSAASTLQAKVIVVMGKTGRTAQKISSARPHVPILTFLGDQKTARQLQYYRAIYPVVDANVQTLDEAVNFSTLHNFADTGDHVIVVSADGPENALGSAVTMRIAIAP